MGEKAAKKSETEDNFQQLRKPKTIAIFLSSICWGLASSLYGVSLLELQRQVGVSLQKISLVLTARATGHMTGSLISGFCYERLENYLVLGTALVGAGVVGACIPFVENYYSLMVTTVVWGHFTGYIDTGNHYLSLHLWGKKAGPVLQTSTLLIAVGGMMVSLIVAPFLTTSGQSTSRTHLTNGSAANYSSETNFTFVVYNDSAVPMELDKTTAQSLFWVPYSVMALAFLCVACLYFSLFLMSSRKLCLTKINDESNVGSRAKQRASRTLTVNRKRPILRAIIIVILSAFFFIYIGSEAVYSGFLHTFAVKCGLPFTELTATYLNTAFWSGVALSRGVAIKSSSFFKPRSILFFNLSGCCLSSIFLSALGDENIYILFFFTVLLGFCMGSAWAAGVMWAERTVTLSGKLTATFVMTASLSYWVFPVIVGYLFSRFSVNSMMYLLLVLSIVSLLLFTVLQILSSMYRGSDDSKNEISEQNYYFLVPADEVIFIETRISSV